MKSSCIVHRKLTSLTSDFWGVIPGGSYLAEDWVGQGNLMLWETRSEKQFMLVLIPTEKSCGLKEIHWCNRDEGRRVEHHRQPYSVGS